MSVKMFVPTAISIIFFFLSCSEKNLETETDEDEFGEIDNEIQDADNESMKIKSIQFEIPDEFTTIIKTTGSRHFAFPDVIKLKNGKLMLVYRSGSGHAEVSGKIFAHFSDDGIEWGIPEVIMDDKTIDDRDPSITMLSNGKVAMNWFKYRYPDDYSEPWAHRIFFSISNNNGLNFDNPVQVDPGLFDYSETAVLSDAGLWIDENSDEIKVFASSSSIVEDEEKLIIPAYGGNCLNFNQMSKTPKGPIVFFTSDNQGKNWKMEPVDAKTPENTWLQEPALLKIDNKRWILQVRTALGSSPGAKGQLMQTVSNDKGITWSPYKSLGFVAHAPELLKLKNSVILSSFRWIDWGLEIKREAVSFVYSLDNGNTWSEIIEIEDCKKAECGYPGLVELENDRVLIVYYSPGGLEIRSKIINFTVTAE